MPHDLSASRFTLGIGSVTNLGKNSNDFNPDIHYDTIREELEATNRQPFMDTASPTQSKSMLTNASKRAMSLNKTTNL